MIQKSSKSIRMQVLVSLEEYTAWYKYAAEHEIEVKNDSDLIRKLMYLIIDIENKDLKIYVLRNKIEILEKKLQQGEEVISRLQTTRIQQIQDLERLKENIKKKRRQKKK